MNFLSKQKDSEAGWPGEGVAGPFVSTHLPSQTHAVYTSEDSGKDTSPP